MVNLGWCRSQWNLRGMCSELSNDVNCATCFLVCEKSSWISNFALNDWSIEFGQKPVKPSRWPTSNRWRTQTVCLVVLDLCDLTWTVVRLRNQPTSEPPMKWSTMNLVRILRQLRNGRHHRRYHPLSHRTHPLFWMAVVNSCQKLSRFGRCRSRSKNNCSIISPDHPRRRSVRTHRWFRVTFRKWSPTKSRRRTRNFSTRRMPSNSTPCRRAVKEKWWTFDRRLP